jgi:uncharacterized membrane protein
MPQPIVSENARAPRVLSVRWIARNPKRTFLGIFLVFPVLVVLGMLPFVTARRPLQIALFCIAVVLVLIGWLCMGFLIRNMAREIRGHGRR